EAAAWWGKTGRLEGVIVVMPAGGLVMCFAERPLDVGSAIVHIELANHDRGARHWIRANRSNLVCNAAKEQIAALAADISTGYNKFAGQFLLHRNVVLIHAFRNFVVRRVSARRKRAIVLIADEVRTNRVDINRESTGIATNNRIDQVALDRLQQVFRLAWTVEDSDTGSDGGLRCGGKGCSESRPEIGFHALIEL